MSKPLAYVLFDALGGLFSRQAYVRLLRWTLVALAVRSPRIRRGMRSCLERILRHQRLAADPAAVARLLGETADHYAVILANLFNLSRLRPRIREEMELDLEPVLERLRAAGRGVILASPHFGDLVLAAAALDEADLPVATVILGARNFQWLCRKRLRILQLGSSAAELVAALRANEAVWLFTDFDFFPGGRTAEFFGAPVYPPHGPARLALASGAPILPVYSVHRNGRWHLDCDEPIAPGGRTQEELEDILLRSMERFVGRYPSQWLILQDPWDLQDVRRHAQWLWKKSA